MLNLLKTRFFGTSHPTIASWTLVKRCNQRCFNCHLWDQKTSELETHEILSTIDRLFLAGVRFLIFTGGEPLLKEGIEQIIAHTFKKGIYVKLNTNGRLLNEKKECLKNLDELHLSLDGPEKVNDYLRGQDSFKYTHEAIILAQRQGVPISMTTVLSKYNLEHIQFLINFAKKYKIKIGFQPASLNYLGSEEDNPLSPIVKEYKSAISYLIKCKRRWNMPIINSITGLKHMYHFPDAKNVFCFTEKLALAIDPDGQIFSCYWGIKRNEYCECHVAPGVSSCNFCWRYDPLELNLIAALKLEPLLNAARLSLS